MTLKPEIIVWVQKNSKNGSYHKVLPSRRNIFQTGWKNIGLKQSYEVLKICEKGRKNRGKFWNLNWNWPNRSENVQSKRCGFIFSVWTLSHDIKSIITYLACKHFCPDQFCECCSLMQLWQYIAKNKEKDTETTYLL